MTSSQSGGSDAASGREHPLPGKHRSSQQQEETRRLFAEYAQTRSLEVRNRLVVLHEPVVRYVAARFGPVGSASVEDLVQVGFMGLISAVERFQPERESSFVTFAVPTIVGVIKHYLRDHTWAVKAPRRLRELGLSLRRLRANLEAKLGRAPTVAEMSEAAGVPEERLLEAMDLDRVYQPASLDSPPPDSEGGVASYGDAVGDLDPELSAIEIRESLKRAMGRLDERQRTIVYYRFFRDSTQAEVARLLGVSQMHVSRLERQALRIIRDFLS